MIITRRLCLLLMLKYTAGFRGCLNPRKAPLATSKKPSRSVFPFGVAPLSAATTMEPPTRLSNSTIPSNQELVAQRLRVEREKKLARERSIHQTNERNLRLKEILTSNNNQQENGAYVVPPLYAVKVSVCEELRQELKLSGREKRGRVFIEKGSDAAATLRSLKFEMHAFFRALRKSSFILSAGFPKIAPDGNILSSSGDVDITRFWPIRTDEDVVRTFAAADEFFAENDSLMKRPSILIHVSRDPDAPPPPPPPAYLENMADPSQTPSMTMLSFYSFPPHGIANPDDFALSLRKAFKPFRALGRIYIATEGVNAQMSVPTNVLDNFIACCRSIPELGEYMENGINIDPKPLTMEEFAVAGVPAADGKPTPPFRNLHIRVRNQIVADGLDHSLDWQSAGYDMPPLEWHENLKKAKEGEKDAIILDCRNNYETDVGRFEGAEPLDTVNFRESWNVLKERLADTPKDAPLFTYCTGGIRCVKVGAYLTQELGFTNVNRLAGGIIAYDKQLSEKAPEEESLFKGTNFVFDGRLGRQITEDALGTCVTCGAETSLVSNCLNNNCHQRMIQCENCRTAYHGTCSDACKNRVLGTHAHPSEERETFEMGEQDSVEEAPLYANLEEYSEGHSSPLPSLYPEMELNTRALIPSGSHMVSGASQGRLLTQLASMTREGRVLELGTFTGYATVCLLEGAAKAGTLAGLPKGNRADGGPYVMTMERDAKAFDVAVAHLEIMSRCGLTEEGAEAAAALRSKGTAPPAPSSMVTLDYQDQATCELVRVTDALATLEEMAAGQGSLQPVAPFDLIFVDADKTRLMEYASACLDSDRLLKEGGLIVVDNVLWKGLVLEASHGDFSSLETEDADDSEIRKNRRARKLANKMHSFNSQIVKDPRAEVVVLPMRDGLSIIRKK